MMSPRRLLRLWPLPLPDNESDLSFDPERNEILEVFTWI